MKLRAYPILIVLLLSFGSAVVAQEEQPPVAVKPCVNQEPPRPPVLKRPQPSPELSQPKEEPCDQAVERHEFRIIEVDSQPPQNEKGVTIKFEGLVTLTQSELRKALRERGVRLSSDPNQEQTDIEKTSAAIQEILVKQGFRHATVAGRVERLEGSERAFVFVVDEGARPSIAEFRFEGNKIFPSQQLASELRQCMDRYERTFYDPEVFDYCIRRLANSVRSKGYLEARFSDPAVDESDGAVTITLQASEGVLYRLGKIEIEGAGFLDPKELRAMLPIQTGDIANGELLSIWLFETLKIAYGERGFIQYTADVTPTFKPRPGGSEGVADFLITIDEGRRFKVRRIFLVGDALPEKQLRGLLLIREGEIFNQSQFERSIEKLNDSGLFQEVDKERDADFRTNEEEGLIDISIKLTKKQG